MTTESSQKLPDPQMLSDNECVCVCMHVCSVCLCSVTDFGQKGQILTAWSN